MKATFTSRGWIRHPAYKNGLWEYFVVDEYGRFEVIRTLECISNDTYDVSPNFWELDGKAMKIMRYEDDV